MGKHPEGGTWREQAACSGDMAGVHFAVQKEVPWDRPWGIPSEELGEGQAAVDGTVRYSERMVQGEVRKEFVGGRE